MMKEEQICENCYYHIYKEECPVPFKTQGELSSTGTFYCPYWTQRDSLAHTLKYVMENGIKRKARNRAILEGLRMYEKGGIYGKL